MLNRAAPGHLCMGTGLCDVSTAQGCKSRLCCMLVVHIGWRSVTGQACTAPISNKRWGCLPQGHPLLEL